MRLGLLKRTDTFLWLKAENFVLQLTYPANTWRRGTWSKQAARPRRNPFCLEIRSINEGAINSTRYRIYSLKVFYCLLYRSLPADVLWGSFVTHSFLPQCATNEPQRTSAGRLTLSTWILFIGFWINLVRVLATAGNTSPIAGYTRV